MQLGLGPYDAVTEQVLNYCVIQINCNFALEAAHPKRNGLAKMGGNNLAVTPSVEVQPSGLSATQTSGCSFEDPFESEKTVRVRTHFGAIGPPRAGTLTSGFMPKARVAN